MKMSGCGCKGKPVAQRDDEAEWIYCDFEDSLVLGGQFFPRTKVEPMSLAENDTRKVSVLSDVCQEMHVHVLSGILSMWFAGQWGGDTAEQVHMTWSTGNNHPIRLAPGQHRFVFFADIGAACTATVTFIDCEAHQGSITGNARQEAHR